MTPQFDFPFPVPLEHQLVRMRAEYSKLGFTEKRSLRRLLEKLFPLRIGTVEFHHPVRDFVQLLASSATSADNSRFCEIERFENLERNIYWKVEEESHPKSLRSMRTSGQNHTFETRRTVTRQATSFGHSQSDVGVHSNREPESPSPVVWDDIG